MKALHGLAAALRRGLSPLPRNATGKRSPPHVAIITHAYDDFASRDYLLGTLAGFWRERGYRVTVVAGLEGWPDADLAILHVDLSIVPDAYVKASRRYPTVLNGAVPDIRKRVVSRNLVRPNDGWTGPVLVKTDLNACGMPELRLLERSNNSPEDLPPGPLAVFGDGRYPILRSPAEVLDAMWHNPGLVVERFLPERDARGFWLRVWVFFGERERCTRYLSADPLIKGRNVLAREPAEVPDELRAERRRLGFDFGKFDFAICDGKAVLYDANRTPTNPPPEVTATLASSNAELATGLDRWLQTK